MNSRDFIKAIYALPYKHISLCFVFKTAVAQGTFAFAVITRTCCYTLTTGVTKQTRTEIFQVQLFVVTSISECFYLINILNYIHICSCSFNKSLRLIKCISSNRCNNDQSKVSQPGEPKTVQANIQRAIFNYAHTTKTTHSFNWIEKNELTHQWVTEAINEKLQTATSFREVAWNYFCLLTRTQAVEC